MKIAILSRDPRLYSTMRLRQAGEARGHELHVIDYLRCSISISSHRPGVNYQGKPLRGLDAVIPRIGASNTLYGTAVVRQFEMMGVIAVNASQAIAQSRDKLSSLQMLSRQGIGLPVTAFAHSIKDVDDVIRMVGGAPLIIKLLEGTQGVGVVLAETHQAAESVIMAFRELDANILVQEFIKEAKGADIRCLVVGQSVVAAMLRQAPPGEFRSNLHRGGLAEVVKLTPRERSMAVRAVKLLGLSVAGVDLLRSKRGPLLLEVNSSPGLEGIEGFTGVDIADRIIQYIETTVESRRNAEPARS